MLHSVYLSRLFGSEVLVSDVAMETRGTDFVQHRAKTHVVGFADVIAVNMVVGGPHGRQRGYYRNHRLFARYRSENENDDITARITVFSHHHSENENDIITMRITVFSRVIALKNEKNVITMRITVFSCVITLKT